MIDTQQPSLEITEPKEGEGVSSNSYIIRGTVDDGEGKGVSTLEYSLDNTNWIKITKAAAWSATGVNFSDGGQGEKTLWVRASDGLNDAVVKSVSFQYDTEDPSLSETTSTLGEALVNRNTSVSFGGEARDTNELKSVTVSVNGGAATTLSTTAGAWTYVLPNADHSNDGTYALVFTATDVAGKTASVKRNVLIDTTKPSTPEFTTSAGDYVTDSLAIAGTASDIGSGIATAHYRVNSEETKTLTGTDNWFATINTSGLAEGAHEVSVWTVDRAGNKSDEKEQSFRVDRYNPEINSDAPASQATNDDITISGSASDSYLMASVSATVSKDGADPSEITPTITNEEDDACDWSIAIDADSLGSGTYVYTIKATDSVGRTASISRTVIIDVDAPTVTDLNLENNFLIRNDSYNVTGKATDNAGGTGVAKVEYSLDNEATWMDATGTDNWLVALSGLTDGLTKTFAVRATDNAGNKSEVVSRTFKVDLADPGFDETNSEIEGQSLVYKNEPVVFKGKVWDANGIESVKVKVNGTEKNIDFTSAVSEPTETNWSWTLDADTENHLKDGTYELVFTAEDTNGRTTSFTRNVMIDTKTPTVAITSPSKDEAVGTASYTIRGT
ncbi:MAG TPA: Ig-like domain-containing protein, partial [bacterium]|nr:Ig-like domain-containing protein [bacterium]